MGQRKIIRINVEIINNFPDMKTNRIVNIEQQMTTTN